MATTGKRGRPKGTGINDHETLLKVAHILAADPKKKRTTAIKDVGISNPSVVRRLRDKYQELEASLLAEVHGTSVKGKRKMAHEAAPAPQAAAPAAKKSKTAHVTEETIAGATAKPAATGNGSNGHASNSHTSNSQGASHKQGPAIDPLAALFDGLNIETLVSQFIGHVLGMDANEIKNSPIPALIRQQAQLADLVLPLLMSQFGNQKSAKAA